MGGQITALERTFSIHVRPGNTVVGTRFTRAKAEAFLKRFNPLLRNRGVFAEMVPEDPHVWLSEPWPSSEERAKHERGR